MINITGNYGHLGILTVVISLSLLDDWMLPFLSSPSGLSLLPLSKFSFVPDFVDLIVSCLAFAAVVVYILASVVPLIDTTRLTFEIPYLPKLYEFLRNFRVVNRYGMFGAMHERRWELIIEGSDDKKVWERYIFYFKACDPKKPLRYILFYWPRLDWHLWFIPLHIQKGNTKAPLWFLRLLGALLKGNKDVLALIEHNPFEKKPPQYVRVSIYDYSFEPNHKSDNWWVEKYIGVYGTTDLENLATFGRELGRSAQ